MPIRITYDEEINGFVIKVTGTLRREDIFLPLDQLINHPKFHKNINQLFDCTEGNLDVTTQDLEIIASDFTQFSDRLGHDRKLAIVAPEDHKFGMMRQYEAFCEFNHLVSVCVFRSFSDARKWLKND